MPAAYANRFADRDALVAGGGGNPTTERAVRAALAWLAAAQEADGHWDPKRYGAGQERYVLGENRGGAGARADTGITALALLAFLGAGHTHREGPYADNVARGLDYLRRSQGANGNLGGDAELFAHMYCHSMATFAVSEACAMTGDDEAAADRRARGRLLARRAAPDRRRLALPRPATRGDTSQLGWQLMALKSAELAGVDDPGRRPGRASSDSSATSSAAPHGGLAAYRPEGPPSRAMTAEALFCRQLLTRRADGGLPPAAIDEARRALLEEPPGGVIVNFYYWYYATIALHRAQRRLARGRRGVAPSGTTRSPARSSARSRATARGRPPACGAATAAACTRRRSPRCAWRCITATRPTTHEPGRAPAATSGKLCRRGERSPTSIEATELCRWTAADHRCRRDNPSGGQSLSADLRMACRSCDRKHRVLRRFDLAPPAR